MITRVTIGSGSSRKSFDIPRDNKGRTLETDREDLKNFIARPKLFAATH